MTPSLVAYLSVTFALVITPGVTTAVVIQQAVRHGRRAGAAAAAGAALGNSTHALAAGAGLALLLRRWPALLDVLQIAGALYLIWLGLATAWRARTPDRHLPSGRDVPDAASATRQGALVTLLNPSIVAFYLTVVPGFVEAADPWWMFFALGALHVSMAFTVHLGWATAFDVLRRIAARPPVLRALDVLAGVALVVLGARLLLG